LEQQTKKHNTSLLQLLRALEIADVHAGLGKTWQGYLFTSQAMDSFLANAEPVLKIIIVVVIKYILAALDGDLCLVLCALIYLLKKLDQLSL